MSDAVIKVANLSKQYTLRHEGKERYVALRDVITRGAASFGRRLVSLQEVPGTCFGAYRPDPARWSADLRKRVRP